MQIITNRDIPLLRENQRNFLEDFQTIIERDCKIASSTKHIVVCAMQKSASTFIVNTLYNVLGTTKDNQPSSEVRSYTTVSLAEGFSLKEFAERLNQNGDGYKNNIIPTHLLYFPKLFMYSCAGFNTISHHHIIANVQALYNFKSLTNIIPIVTTRNIMDALISLRDHWIQAYEGMTDIEITYAFDNIITRFCTRATLDKFMTKSFEYQMDFLIDLGSPWFFEFILSWEEVKRKSILNALIIRYEDFIKDECGAIAEAIRFVGENVDEEKIRRVVEKGRKHKKENRLNVGKAGRGRELLTDCQQERIRRIGQYYADDDIIMKYV